MRAERARKQNDKVIEALREATKKEVLQGIAAGPFTAAKLTERLGPCWVPSRRFGVKQGQKV